MTLLYGEGLTARSVQHCQHLTQNRPNVDFVGTRGKEMHFWSLSLFFCHRSAFSFYSRASSNKVNIAPSSRSDRPPRRAQTLTPAAPVIARPSSDPPSPTHLPIIPRTRYHRNTQESSMKRNNVPFAVALTFGALLVFTGPLSAAVGAGIVYWMAR